MTVDTSTVVGKVNTTVDLLFKKEFGFALYA